MNQSSLETVKKPEEQGRYWFKKYFLVQWGGYIEEGYLDSALKA